MQTQSESDKFSFLCSARDKAELHICSNFAQICSNAITRDSTSRFPRLRFSYPCACFSPYLCCLSVICLVSQLPVRSQYFLVSPMASCVNLISICTSFIGPLSLFLISVVPNEGEVPGFLPIWIFPINFCWWRYLVHGLASRVGKLVRKGWLGSYTLCLLVQLRPACHFYSITPSLTY